MREITPGVFLETQYPLCTLGAVVSNDLILTTDCPMDEGDIKSWVDDLSRLGKVKFTVLMDHHAERIIGARLVDTPLIAHNNARLEMTRWPDTFKGNAYPIGSPVDSMKRVPGISRAIPDLSFSVSMDLKLGELDIVFEHRPGPMLSSCWMFIPEREVVFIGDTVCTRFPPFFGYADLEAWFEALDELRDNRFKDYILVSSRDGVIDRQNINSMARFLRKVRDRVEKTLDVEDPEEVYAAMAEELLEDFPVPPELRPQGILRIKAGLKKLHMRLTEDKD